MKRVFMVFCLLAAASIWAVGYVPGVVAAASFSGESSEGARPEGPPPRGHNPPPEAYKTCEGKEAGTKTQFTTPRGDSISGVCELMDGKMVLKPDFTGMSRQ